MKIVDPRHLLQFHEIVRTGSFTRAAETLGLTQPALTRNMKLMEGRLGFELLVRSRQGIVPTNVGLRILEEASMVVLAEQRIGQLTNSFKRGFDAELRIGCTPSAGIHILPQPLAQFARQFPEVRLDIRNGHIGMLADMLIRKEVDLILSPTSVIDLIPNSTGRHFFDNQMKVLASMRHPLASKSLLRPDDFKGQRWVLYRPETSIRRASDRLLRRLGIGDNPEAMELPSNMIAALLHIGDHLAIAPDYVLHSADNPHDLAEIQTGISDITISFGAIWAKETPLAKYAEAFIASMATSLAVYHHQPDTRRKG